MAGLLTEKGTEAFQDGLGMEKEAAVLERKMIRKFADKKVEMLKPPACGYHGEGSVGDTEDFSAALVHHLAQPAEAAVHIGGGRGL